MFKILLAVIFFFLIPKPAYGQTSFMVKPSIITLESASSSATITVYNVGSTELTISHTSLQLEAGNDGSLIPSLPIKPVEDIATESGSTDTPIVIPPHESRQIRFTIPANLTSGRKTPGILFTTQSAPIPTDKTASSISGGIIVPILQMGNQKSQLVKIAHFSSPLFTTSNTLPFVLTLQNPGNIPAQVSGTLIIRNALNREIARFSLPEHIILSQQYRNVTSADPLVWKPKLIIGFYTAEIVLDFGGQHLSQRILFFGFPYRFTALLVIFVLISSGIYLRVRKYRQ
jgi:hypothetical protein